MSFFVSLVNSRCADNHIAENARHCFYLAIAQTQPVHLALIRSRALTSDRLPDASGVKGSGERCRRPLSELKIGHQVLARNAFFALSKLSNCRTFSSVRTCLS